MKGRLKDLYKKHDVEAWYLLLSFLLVVVLFWQVLFHHKLVLFGDVASDTLQNYLPNYTYYVENIRHFTLSVFDFTLGTGTSIFSMPNFLSDPLLPLLLLFPKSRLADGIFLISVLKILLIGFLALKLLQFHFKRRGPLLAGSLVYAFSGYILVWGQHFQFLINVFWFTLLLYAFERWFADRRKKLLLIFVLAINIAGSLYFAYMSILFMGGYIAIRMLSAYGIRGTLKTIPDLLKVAVPGIFLSMVSALPQLYILRTSPRIGTMASLADFFRPFTAETYATMVGKFFSDSLFGPNDAGVTLGAFNIVHILLHTSVLVLLLLPVIFFIRSRKKKALLLGSLGVLLFSFAVPFVPYLFNKFAQVQFRWSYVLIPVAVYYIIVLLTELLARREELKGWKLMAGFTGAYLLAVAALVWVRSVVEVEGTAFLLTLAVATAFYILLSVYAAGLLRSRGFQAALLLLILLEIPASSLNTLLNNRGYYDRSYLEGASGYYEPDTSAAFAWLKETDGSFYRAEMNYYLEFLNDSEILDYYGFNLYNALPTASYARFNQLTSTPFNTKWGIVIKGAADDNYLQNLLAKKYAVIKGDEKPFGYDLVRTFGAVKVYENRYDLGPVLVYNQSISLADYQKRTLAERRDLLWNTVVLADTEKTTALPESPKLEVPEQTLYVGDEEVRAESDISVGHGATVIRIIPEVPMDYAQLTLSSDYNEKLGLEQAAVRIRLEGEETYRNDEVISLNDGVDSKDIGLNLDYQGIVEVDLVVPAFTYLQEGYSYHLRNLRLEKKDTAGWLDAVEGFRERGEFVQTASSRSSIAGVLTVREAGMAVISVPYDEGWVLTIDGKETPYQEVNGGFVGFPVEPGVRTIVIRYRHPLLGVGAALSLAGLGLAAVIVALEKKRMK